MISTAFFLLREYQRFQSKRLLTELLWGVVSAFILTTSTIWIVYLITEGYEKSVPVTAVFSSIAIIAGLTFILNQVMNYYNKVVKERYMLEAKAYFVQKVIKKTENIDLEAFYSSKFHDCYSLVFQCAQAKMEESLAIVFNFIFQLMALVNALAAVSLINPALLGFAIFIVLSTIAGNSLNKRLFKKNSSLINSGRKQELFFETLFQKETIFDLQTSDIGSCFQKYQSDNTKERLALTKSSARALVPLKIIVSQTSINLIYISALLISLLSFYKIDEFKVSDFSILFSSVILLLSRIKNCFKCYESFGSNRPYIEAYQDFGTQNTVRKKIAAPFKSIAFEQVDYQYPSSETALLKNVTLTINHGDKIAVIGENGSGKSTFLNLLSGVLKPTAGEIIINENYNTKAYDLSSFSKIVQQDFFLPSIALKENIMGTSTHNERYKDLINESWFSIDQKYLNRPFGKEVSEEGVILSGGEAQKIAIARALFSDKDILIFDEATSAMDKVSERLLFQKLARTQLTWIFSVHNQELARYANRIFYFKAGIIQEFRSMQEYHAWSKQEVKMSTGTIEEDAHGDYL
ncbi:ATP-binding cassette domain-containing protein [Candidatus Enterococcus leclercqii]|uniref:ATP-binding cassette domain-containing protein n=1 Tax=Candidatus Enterococcus leclercqii TaxID=1857218 RepID=UPI00137A2F3D|nr:ATP-binding cassette domain-containing protein [Enterococcus sp. CU9D]KAF1292233.1 hypothetical protein BAU14_06815 [Enterococcus sp. CU9D]